MKRKRGFVLITTLFISTILILFGLALVRDVFLDYSIATSGLNGTKSFYLAEAGIEKAKVEVVQNPNWYTDLPHVGADDVSWLAFGAVGKVIDFHEGHFKIVKEDGKKIIYSIGYLGKTRESRGMSIIKIEYSYPPFEKICWRIL